MESGIYKITNKVNNKIYIGSSIDIKERWYSHKNYLNKNKHNNLYLLNAWNKYKEENFVFEILELVDDNTKLIEREQFYIDTLTPCDRNIGYNISPTAGSTLGYKHTESAKEKVRQANLGKTYSDEINKSKGRTTSKSEIHKLNISKSLKGNIKILGRITYTKPVLQFDLNDNLINRWDSGKIASETLKISHTSISACCNNRMIKYNNCIWRFEFGDKKITNNNKND